MRRISAATPTQPLSRSSRTPTYASPMKSAATVRRSTSIQRSFVMGGRQLFPGGHAEAKGRRPTMEDACASCGEFAGPRTQYYGLFDGHGGKEVALYCAEHLHHLIAREMGRGFGVPEAIRASIRAVNADVLKKWDFAGTTAAIVVIARDTIYAANVGDSRVVMVENGIARRLTFDHKATVASEKRLIVARGGRVFMGRVNGILMVSRAIGDAEIAKFITCDPYQTTTNMRSNQRLIIACDGVWDVMTDQDAADIMARSEDPKDAARAIKAEALRRGTMDNVSVMCVDLKYKDSF